MTQAPDSTLATHEGLHSDACLWPKHREEAWASANSSITRLTGWITLGVQAVLLVSLFFFDDIGLDILAVIAGFKILKGRQSWLRFHIFSSAFFALSLWLTLAPALILGRPVQIDLFGPSEWLTRSDLRLWTHPFALAGVFTMDCGFSLLCLRTRNLAFWTRSARQWGGFIGVFIAIGLIASAIEAGYHAVIDLRTKTRLKVEIEAVRDELKFSLPAEPLLRGNPEIRGVGWEYLSGGFSILYQKVPGTGFDLENADLRLFHEMPGRTDGFIHFFLDPAGTPEDSP